MRGLLLLLLTCLLCACGAPERRANCTVAIYAHPTKKSPAGRIVVRCDGLDRATIDADHVRMP